MSTPPGQRRAGLFQERFPLCSALRRHGDPRSRPRPASRRKVHRLQDSHRVRHQARRFRCSRSALPPATATSSASISTLPPIIRRLLESEPGGRRPISIGRILRHSEPPGLTGGTGQPPAKNPDDHRQAPAIPASPSPGSPSPAQPAIASSAAGLPAPSPVTVRTAGQRRGGWQCTTAIC